MKYLRIFGLYFKIGSMGEMQYRFNFFVHLFQSILQLGIAIVGLAVIFSYTDALGGWLPDEVLALVGVYTLVGGLIGGILLVQTPSSVFDRFVPFLILFATVLFMAHSLFSRLFASRHVQKGTEPTRRWIIGAMAFQLGVAIYGGYFGAGIGILMLASLGMLGFEDVHEMNTVKVVLGFMINVGAAVYFIASGLIAWAEAGVMAGGTIAGGFLGAHYAQKVKQTTVRRLITVIGLGISAYMFYKQA